LVRREEKKTMEIDIHSIECLIGGKKSEGLQANGGTFKAFVFRELIILTIPGKFNSLG